MTQPGNAATETTTVRTGQGVTVARRFTEPGVHPFDAVEWEIRDAVIGDPEAPAFEQRDVEFPAAWSQNATNIVAQKYFRGRLGYFASHEDADAFEAELTHILLHQMAAFNSPVWFNVGFEEHPQCSACFILSVEDTMESILGWNTKEGMIFRGGSGSGINLSRIRGSKEHLSKGGLASGPVSFMRGADAWAGTIKSGGKTRRAAKMVVLDVDHPDIVDFIWCKAREEEQAVEDGQEWQLVARAEVDPETGERKVVDTLDARELMRQIADAAWRCADPGVQYDTTIQRWHTDPNTGPITASNPCSEYMSIDDSACNLASLNLMKFRNEDGTFNVDDFTHAVDIVFLAQEILVGFSSYPTEEITKNARAFRQLGLGYANLGALLMSNGLAYDSDEGRALAGSITALMTGRAYRKSAEVAEAIGPYARYAENREPHLRVMGKHRDAAY